MKTVKIKSLPIGSTFESEDGRIGTLISVDKMGAMVQYKGERTTIISSSSPVIKSETTKSTWVFDDGGRKKSGYKGFAGDCVCRSIAIATKLPYKEVYDRLADGMATQRKSKHTANNLVLLAMVSMLEESGSKTIWLNLVLSGLLLLA